MRIAHVVSTYPPYHGGMGNVAQAMAQGLRERGHDCDVFTPDYRGEDAAGVIRLRPWFSSRNAAFVPSLASRLKEGKYDVVHLHYPFLGGAESVFWFKWRNPKTRLFITYHMDTFGRGWRRAVLALYRRLFMRHMIRQADVVTCSSLDYAKHSALAGLRNLNPVELPFGVADRFKPQVETPAAADKLVLLFVGGLDQAHYFKGLSVLFASLASLNKTELSKLGLNIVGDGDLRGVYEASVKDLGLQEQVHFSGKLDESGLVVAYQQADVTVLPSIDRSEAFGLVLLESMACGTPVIASDLPGVRTVLERERTGFLVRPNDVKDLAERLSFCVRRIKLLREMRPAAAKRVQDHYRWPHIIEQLESLYRNA